MEEDEESPTEKKSNITQGRHYQHRNLDDLEFSAFTDGGRDCEKDEASEEDSNSPGLTKYFIKTNRYRTTRVLEENVIDNELLKKTALFKALAPRFVEELLKTGDCMRAIVYMPGMELVTQGDWADYMVVLAQGECEIVKDGVVMRRLVEGDCFGSRSFIGVNQRRRATVRATTFCDVRLMYREAFINCIGLVPTVSADLRRLWTAWKNKTQDETIRGVKKFTDRWASLLEPPPTF
eukprot:TRINITY_DN36588_c0_g1_i1.p1 TRINITY_DN36588_c0_g1~~TRINITY_DN36588_c0_g1_i1.p1  ORF type:complete len:236 (-),score=38.07 TRINITY_DN36588_c0_g1_i1:46-753(-)